MLVKMKVPKSVADALDYHKEKCASMSNDTFNHILMAIPFSNVHGKAQILKDFAKEKPTLYLHALVYGYEPNVDIQDELTEMIETWLNKSYVEDEKRDIQDFAHMLTKYFQQNG